MLTEDMVEIRLLGSPIEVWLGIGPLVLAEDEAPAIAEGDEPQPAGDAGTSQGLEGGDGASAPGYPRQAAHQQLRRSSTSPAVPSQPYPSATADR
ncbi:MAG: hypothetical protein DLM70_03735 [Chloroflexi bacterium]|nr:MAG: hypothetical protein DLM70_03735 [Chloroflexota bacterium]